MDTRWRWPRSWPPCPPALAETRRALDEALELDYADALDLEARMQGELGRGHDFAEGVSAFFGQARPVFKDR
jgi:2-(1,2-epoxy-1,2-dihydrophenyl)acetyl-CoA isomerase